MMNNKLWLNLALLTFVLALAGVAFYEPGKEESKVIHLTEAEPALLEKVELRNKETLIFERRDGHWWLTKPFQALANDIRVHQLLEIPRAESEAQYPLKQEDLAKYELDKPKATLIIGDNTLMFGGSDPLDMRRYVQIGDTLHLVNDDFFHHLTASSTDFVDKKLLPDDKAPNEFLLPGIKGRLGADGKWIMEPAGDLDAGMPDLVSAWRGVRAIDVRRVEKPPQGDVIRIGFDGKPALEFIIVQREPDLVLARTDWGLEYVLPVETGKRLLTLQKPETGAVPGDKVEPEEDESSGGMMDEDVDVQTEEDLEMPMEDDDEEAAGQDGKKDQ